MNITRKALLFFFLASVCAWPLFSEVLLTANVKANPEKAEMKKRGEPGYVGDIYMDFADTNPGLGEAGAYQAACHEFAMGFLGDDFYMNIAISNLRPQFYELMYVDGRTYTPPVLNRQSSHYMASLNTIMQKYLQTAMPDDVKLTLDIDAFMAEVSRQADRIDRVRAAQGFPTCAQHDALLAQSMKKIDALGASVRDGGMVIKQDEIAWLDALVGKPRQDQQILSVLRNDKLYKEVLKSYN
jgi:hypothetical protein